jgi:hypothetical protein
MSDVKTQYESDLLIMQQGLDYLDWQGGTIWQIEDALIKRLNTIGNDWSIVADSVHGRVKQMLDLFQT